MHRNDRREGLIRSRLRGYELSTADTLTFLDAHIECVVGWLEPLLERVAIDSKILISPVVDIIGKDDFHFGGIGDAQRGAFELETLVFRMATHSALIYT